MKSLTHLIKDASFHIRSHYRKSQLENVQRTNDCWLPCPHLERNSTVGVTKVQGTSKIREYKDCKSWGTRSMLWDSSFKLKQRIHPWHLNNITAPRQLQQVGQQWIHPCWWGKYDRAPTQEKELQIVTTD